MRLAALADSNFDPIHWAELAGDAELARDIQGRLVAAGLVDPPVDGKLGPVSLWGVSQIARKLKLSISRGDQLALDVVLAKALLSSDLETLYPLLPKGGDMLTGKIVAALFRRGYWLCRHPDCVNIAYVEGMNVDGTRNDNKPNVFNDVRLLIAFDESGEPYIAAKYQGTTEPGRYWTEHPMSPNGAARIEFGQYKAWSVGTHHPGSRGAHEALVQVADVIVCRDKNKDYKRDGDRRETGIFAINQHWGYDLPPGDLGKSSAGCLVGRTKDEHRDFMKRVKADARYKVNKSYRFMTAVIPVAALDEGSFDPNSPH